MDNVITAYSPKNFGKNASIVMVDIDPNQLKTTKIKAIKKVTAAASQFLLETEQIFYLSPTLNSRMAIGLKNAGI